MSEVFVASNGVEVSQGVGSGGRFGITLHGIHHRFPLNSEMVQGLREFFLHERDLELGRWRDPKNPDYVVYYYSYIRTVKVVNELTGESLNIGPLKTVQGLKLPYKNHFEMVADAYFVAHPEPRPWLDAKVGEVWELTYRSPSQNEASNRVMTCVDDGGNISFFNEYRLHTVQYTGIESARRIWPENKVG